jgi:anti-sigma factor RsiW
MRLTRRRKDISCEQAVELITDYLEDALPSRQRSVLEYHLRDCPHCTEYLAQLRTTIAVTGHVDTEELDPQMRETLIELYRKTLPS